MDKPLISIKNLTKKYDKKVAVSDLSLDCLPGDITAFIGLNGAGKTTTIKCLTGILPFDEGEILIDTHSIKSDPIAAKRAFAYIPDSPDLYEFYTGYGYLNFISDIFSLSNETRRKNIKIYAERFDLTAKLDDPISSYSHGMKQKLAIVSGLIREPKILILDEPFVGLDPKSTFELKKIMHEICENGGSCFFSTHVLDVAQNLCNKVAIIKDGKLVKFAKMEELTDGESLEDAFLSISEG